MKIFKCICKTHSKTRKKNKYCATYEGISNNTPTSGKPEDYLAEGEGRENKVPVKKLRVNKYNIRN